MRPGRDLAIAGAIGLSSAAAFLGLQWTFTQLDLVSFLPFDIAEAVIHVTPGQVASQGIERLGAVAKAIVELAGFAVVLLTGGLAGVLLARLRAHDSAASIAPLLAFALLVVVGVQAVGGRFHDVIELGLLALLLGGWAIGLVMLLRVGLRQSASPSRRDFVRRAGAVLFMVGVGGALAGELIRDQRQRQLAQRLAQGATDIPGAPLGASVSLPVVSGDSGVRPAITPIADLYTIFSTARAARVDLDRWRLRVDGLVAQSQTLTYPGLRAWPRVDQLTTLECISNEVGGNLIGTIRWSGVRLRDLLAAAGLTTSAAFVVLRSVDGYADSIPLARALDPDVLIAYGMNGTALSADHGFPCRLIVPGLYGYKNVKWLSDIIITEADEPGFWERRGWSDAAMVKTQATIDTGNPALDQSSDVRSIDGLVDLGGYGFAGTRGISRVDVRIDDGDWRSAELEPVESAAVWRCWRLPWRATPGQHTLAVRATDGVGQIQTAEQAPPHPDGAAGWHTLDLEVS
jgi:DMSO/TMAO reductase YedYZ molybdopterin-dependent catalytic subunit